MPNRSTVVRLFLPFVWLAVLSLAGCGNADTPEPSAPATVVGSAESTAADPLPADDSAEETGDTEQTAAADGQGDKQRDEADPDTADAADSESDLSGSTDDGSSQDVGKQGVEEQGSDEPGNAGSSGSQTDLLAALPAPDAIAGATASGYTSIDELIADRSERPPLLRCGASDDPTSLAIATQAQAVGRSFDYDDGLRTTTVQLWAYPDAAAARRAMALIGALVCDEQAVGPITIDGTDYDQFDSAAAAEPVLDGEGVDEMAGANFERQLTSSTTDLVVQEELQFARVGNVVVFAGAREIRTPDVDDDLPVADSHRVALGTIAVLLGKTEAGSIRSPATQNIGSAESGTYRSFTTGFCLVRIDNADGSATQVSWGDGEQALLTAALGQTIAFGEGCGSWNPIDPATATSTLAAGASGTLLVGTDIPAGPLVVTSVGDCSVDQLTGFSGAGTDLISSTILAPGDSIEIDLASVGIYLASDCRY